MAASRDQVGSTGIRTLAEARNCRLQIVEDEGGGEVMRQVASIMRPVSDRPCRKVRSGRRPWQQGNGNIDPATFRDGSALYAVEHYLAGPCTDLGTRRTDRG